MRQEDHDLLTRTGPGTPMGEMLRQYWVPAIRSGSLERDGAPARVRLFGQNFVAFRVTDGRVGFIDEACPHRGVSMALARNEDNGLRCIFHGWKRDVSGAVVDAPCEPADRRQRFCANVRVNKYLVHEAAGVVWVFLGKGEAPRFPNFEFAELPLDQVIMRRAVVPYNWRQGTEAHIDSAHVPFLHRGFLQHEYAAKLDPDIREGLTRMLDDTAPKFESDETPYGLREAALRDLGNGMTYARVREIVLPFYTFIPGGFKGACHGRLSVPIDDETTADWYVVYDSDGPLKAEEVKSIFQNTSDNPDDFADNLGTSETLWGQDRAEMKKGHFSGLTRAIPFEDFIVQASMGRCVDSTTEQLGTSDIIIVKTRRLILEAIHAFESGGTLPWTTDFSYSDIRARAVTYDRSKTWRDFMGQPQALSA